MSGEEVVDGVVEGALKVDPPKSMSAPSSGKGVETACKSAEGYPYDKFFQYLERKHSRSFSGAALVIENTDLNRSLGKESEEEVGSVHSSKGPVTMLSPADIEYSEREGSVIQENFHSESGKSHSSLKHRNVSTQDFKELFDRIDRYVNVLVKIKLSVEAHLQNCKKLCKSASKTASVFVDVWRDTGVRHLDIISKAESAHRQIEFDALDILVMQSPCIHFYFESPFSDVWFIESTCSREHS